MIIQRVFVLLFALVLMVLVASPLVAQVNTEKIRIGEDKDGIGFELKGTFAFRYGNTNYLDIGGSSRFHFKKNRYLTFLLSKGQLKFGYADTNFDDPNRLVYKIFTHNRHVIELSDRIWTEVFFQHEFNEFLNLRVRLLGGLGVRFALIQQKNVELFFGTAYMFEYEHLNLDVTDLGDSKTYLNRWSNYLSLKLLPSDVFGLSFVVYFQPVFNRFKDFRLLAELNMEFKVTEAFFLGPNFYLRYDNEKPASVAQALDFEMDFGLKVLLETDFQTKEPHLKAEQSETSSEPSG